MLNKVENIIAKGEIAHHNVFKGRLLLLRQNASAGGTQLNSGLNRIPLYFIHNFIYGSTIYCHRSLYCTLKLTYLLISFILLVPYLYRNIYYLLESVLYIELEVNFLPLIVEGQFNTDFVFCFIGVLRRFQHYFSYFAATVNFFMIPG